MNNITTSLTKVLNLGAKVVVVPNMIDIGLTPLAIANNATSTLTDLSQAHNQALEESLSELRGNHPDAKIIEVDMYNFFNDIFPEFANNTEGVTTTNLYDTPVTPTTIDFSLLFSPDPLNAYLEASQRAEDYLWWDSAHPTTTAHQLISNHILEVIEDNIAIKGTNPRDILTGTSSNDLIIASPGRDVLTGGSGRDVFVYDRLTNAGDMITDFTVGEDRLNFVGVLKRINFTENNPLGRKGYITFNQLGQNKTLVKIDADGSLGRAPAVPYITLENVDATALNNGSNFIFS